MTTTFAALGLSADLVAALDERGITEPVPHPGAHHRRRPRRPRRVRQGQDRLGQDARLRPAAARAHRPRPSPRHPARARARAHPRARPAGARRARAARPRPSACRVAAVYGGADIEQQIKALAERRRHRRRHARPADRPHRPRGASSLDGRRASSCSTRPTAWPTWGSCPRSSGCCASSTHRHQTLLFSATLDGAVDTLVKRYLHDPVHARGRVDHGHRRRDGAPLPARPPDGQGEGRGGDRRGADRTLVFVRTKRGADRLAAAARARRACRPPPSTATSARRLREKALARLRRRQAAGARGHRRRRPGHPRRRRRRRRPLRPARGPQGLPAPLGPHRPGRRVRRGRHARAVGPGARGQAAAEAHRRRRQPIVEVFSNDPRLADLAGWDPTAAA